MSLEKKREKLIQDLEDAYTLCLEKNNFASAIRAKEIILKYYDGLEKSAPQPLYDLDTFQKMPDELLEKLVTSLMKMMGDKPTIQKKPRKQTLPSPLKKTKTSSG